MEINTKYCQAETRSCTLILNATRVEMALIIAEICCLVGRINDQPFIGDDTARPRTRVHFDALDFLVSGFTPVLSQRGERHSL